MAKRDRDKTLRKMAALGHRHADLEAKRDLEGVMETLVPHPSYEFYPAGLRMEGVEAVRHYYLHLFDEFIPKTRSYRLLEEWVSETSVAQEYEIQLDVDGALETHRVIGILFAEGKLLGGERVYAGEHTIRRMVGPLFDELQRIRFE